MAKLCSSVQVLVLINMNDLSMCAKINSYSFLLLDAHLQKPPTEASSSPTPHLHVVPDQFTDFPSCGAIGSSRGQRIPPDPGFITNGFSYLLFLHSLTVQLRFWDSSCAAHHTSLTENELQRQMLMLTRSLMNSNLPSFCFSNTEFEIRGQVM